MSHFIYKKIKQLEKENQSRKESQGVVYTPKYICDYIIERLHPSLDETVLEPSSGHGVFVFSLLDYIKNKYNLEPSALLQYLNEKVFSFEINEKVSHEFQSMIKEYFKNLGIDNAYYYNLYNEDTLFSKNIDRLYFDIGVGNPPYIRIRNIDIEYANMIRKKYTSCEKGNIDIYYAFIELAMSSCKRVGMITPNSYMTNKSAQSLRDLMLKNIHIVIDFKDKMIFSNASTYTSIFILLDKEESYLHYSNDIDKEFIEKESSHFIGKKWYMDEYKPHTGSININSPYDINSGIATLRDKVFIVESNNKNDIEDGILVDFYKITKREKKKIILPYDINNTILDETFIAKRFPRCYQYLLSHKNDLCNRDKGKIDKYDAWYAYGRKQGLPKGSYQHHLMIPIMFSKDTETFILHSKDPILFSSGYMMSSDDIVDIKKTKDLLDSEEFFHYISVYGKIWKGKVGSPYYTFGINVLKNFLKEKIG